MTTIAFADDHAILRSCITTIINSFEDFRVIGQAADGAGLIKCFEESGVPQLLLLDVSMFGMSGYETAVWVKQHHSSVKIVVLSMFSAPVQIARMLTAGIKGFLDKNIEPEELYRALRYVAMNETLYMEGNHGKLAELVSSLGEPALLDKRRVTEREIEFIQLACCDYTHREIARRMHVSGRTESNIMASVYQKLQVKSRAAMVMSAARMGIVPLYQ